MQAKANTDQSLNIEDIIHGYTRSLLFDMGRHHRVELCYINASILDYAYPYAKSLLYNSVARITIYTVVSNTKSDVVVN